MITLKKIPGGTVIVPMILGMLINTMCPNFLNLGGTSTALFKNGSTVLMGVFLIICGSQIEIKEAKASLYKGSLLLSMKLIIAGLLGYLLTKLVGPAGLLGITPFAIYCAIPSNNSSLYLALSSIYGDTTDAGAVSVLSLKNGPFGTLIVMGISGAAYIPFNEIISVLILLAIGMVWGNLDKVFKKMCMDSQDIIVILMTFAIGANAHVSDLIEAGIPGVILGGISIVVGLLIHFVYNLILKKRNVMGIAMGATAANSILTPALIASISPQYDTLVISTAAMCATASIMTMVLIPFIMDWFYKKE